MSCVSVYVQYVDVGVMRSEDEEGGVRRGEECIHGQ